MYTSSNNGQRGFIHIGIIILILIVVGGIGFAGWRVMSSGKSSSEDVANKALSAATSKACLQEVDDKDLCKFLSSWNVNQKFKLTSSTVYDGKSSTTEMTVDGDSTYMKMDGEYAMEVITIGDATYTKAGQTWWKQTAKPDEKSETTTEKDKFKFEEPKATGDTKDQTKYEKVGKEACGKLSCFKYKIVDPANTTTTEHIWFDDKDFLVRRSLTEGTDGTKSDSVFSYDNISVKAPASYKELGADQYILPGQTEPQTMPSQPSESEMQDMMSRYGQ